MQIEIGKAYINDRGNKVRISSASGMEDFPFRSSGGLLYTRSGECFLIGVGNEIVGEWTAFEEEYIAPASAIDHQIDIAEQALDNTPQWLSETSGALLPTDAKERKNIPLFSGLIKYFPNALVAVAECSKIGNDQHNPGKPLHWDRSKSDDELEALTRHLFRVGQIDSDGIRESTKVAWRALANLQKEIETELESDV